MQVNKNLCGYVVLSNSLPVVMPVFRDTSTMTESVNFSDGPARETTSTKAYSKDSSAHPSPKDTSTEVNCVSLADLTDGDPNHGLERFR